MLVVERCELAGAKLPARQCRLKSVASHTTKSWIGPADEAGLESLRRFAHSPTKFEQAHPRDAKAGNIRGKLSAHDLMPQRKLASTKSRRGSIRRAAQEVIITVVKRPTVEASFRIAEAASTKPPNGAACTDSSQPTGWSPIQGSSQSN